MNTLSKLVCAVALSLPLGALTLAPTTAAGDTPVGGDVTLTVLDTITDPAGDAPPVVVEEAQRAAWEKELRAARAEQIARLKTYAARGEFAMNLSGGGLSFVWRDAEGRLCAMAHLVNASGRSDLVDQVAREHNDLQLASVKDGALHEWMLRSGLTKEEIQLVQEPAFVVQPNRAEAQKQWEIARKRAHLASVVERLEMSTDDSIATAVARLAGHAADAAE